MNRILLALGFGAAVIGLSACAEDYGGPRHYAAYDHNPIGYDGFYDGYYGPFYDGYWGDGGFYYSTGEGRPYVRDDGNHFRHESGAGMTPFHGGVHIRAGRG
jgi:hypothetical protein